MSDSKVKLRVPPSSREGASSSSLLASSSSLSLNVLGLLLGNWAFSSVSAFLLTDAGPLLGLTFGDSVSSFSWLIGTKAEERLGLKACGLIGPGDETLAGLLLVSGLLKEIFKPFKLENLFAGCWALSGAAVETEIGRAHV